MILDALDNVLHTAFREPFLPQRVTPDRMLESCAHLDDELGGRGHAEYDARPAMVHTLTETTSVFENTLGCDQRDKLSRIGRGHRCGRNAELHRIERDRAEKPTSLGIRHIRSGWIRIVIVVDKPAVRWHVSQAIGRGHDVAPESDQVLTPCKEGAHSYDGDRRRSRHLYSHRS